MKKQNSIRSSESFKTLFDTKKRKVLKNLEDSTTTQNINSGLITKKTVPKILIISISLIILNSCSKIDMKSRIKGQWAIEEVIYSGKSYKDQMYSNVLIFEDNDKISIPESVHFKKDRSSSWQLLKKNNSMVMIIKSSNKVFTDTFEIKFIKNEKKKLRGVILQSDTIQIEAYKLLQNYDRW